MTETPAAQNIAQPSATADVEATSAPTSDGDASPAPVPAPDADRTEPETDATAVAEPNGSADRSTPIVVSSPEVAEAARAAQKSAAEQVDVPREVSDPDENQTPSVASDDQTNREPNTPDDTPRDGADIIASARVWLRDTWAHTKKRVSEERERVAERAEERETAREQAKEAAARASAEKEKKEAAARAAEESADALVVPSAAGTDVAEDGVVSAAPETPRGAVTLAGVRKNFGDTVAVTEMDLSIPSGSFYGIVGPNGAGKTTTLSMITGLLRPDAGTITVGGTDVWSDPSAAKRMMGTLPDRMRLFDRLTGAQLLYYSGVLRGLNNVTVRARVKSLTRAFGLEDAIGRLVSDYSAGMSKKIALACALIHSPRVVILDEPFESVDPVSAASITEILHKYVENGGTVILSSHGMDFIERVCDNVAIIVDGSLLASGTIDEVRDGGTLEERFIALVGRRKATEDLEWLHSFSD